MSHVQQQIINIHLQKITKKPSQQGLHNEQAPGQRRALSKNDLRVTSKQISSQERRPPPLFGCAKLLTNNQ
jgi:hypothetical protein